MREIALSKKFVDAAFDLKIISAKCYPPDNLKLKLLIITKIFQQKQKRLQSKIKFQTSF